MKQWNIAYQQCFDHPDCADHGYYRVAPKTLRERLAASYALTLQQVLGFTLLAVGLGGILGPMIPTIRLEGQYAFSKLLAGTKEVNTLPTSAPVVFEPLLTPDGATIDPINEDFALIVPKVGINATVIPGVNPLKPNEYQEALKTGVAHASTSFLPDEDGTVYLFSHSTNYDWFVQDLNAVFYLLKNLEEGDHVVLMYKGKRYTYIITGKKVVSPSNTTYLYPYVGHRNLILQTCWPPGSTAERLLIFADLVEEHGVKI